MNALGSVSQTALVAVMRYGTRGVVTPAPQPDEVVQVPSRDAGRTIKVHVYRAAGAARPAPVLVNFHGSGFVLPLHGSDDGFARRVRDGSPYAVLDVQYRLAPEHPFPAACDDAEDVVRWAREQTDEFDTAAPRGVAVSGFSAGGNLALGVAASLGPDAVGRVAAFYPVCDLAADAGAKTAPVPGGQPIPAFAARLFDACYTPAPTDRRDPRVSPLFAAPDRFPARVLVVTCDHDTLAPEAEALADKIAAVPGKRVVHRRIDDADHAWDKKCRPGTPQEAARDEAYDMVIKMLCE